MITIRFEIGSDPVLRIEISEENSTKAIGSLRDFIQEVNSSNEEEEEKFPDIHGKN